MNVDNTNAGGAEKFIKWFTECLSGVQAKNKVNSLIAGLRRRGIDIVGISKETQKTWLSLLCPRRYIRAGDARRTIIIDSLISAGLIKVGRLRRDPVLTDTDRLAIKECITELIRVNLQDIDNKVIYGSMIYGPVDSGKTHFVREFLKTQKVRPVFINANDIDSMDFIEKNLNRSTETGEHVLSMMGAQGYSGSRVLVIDDFDSVITFRQYTLIVKQLILLFKPTKGRKSLHHIESIFAGQKIIAPVIIIANNPLAKKIYNMYRVFKAFPSAIIKWEQPSDSDIRTALLRKYSESVPEDAVDKIVTAARGHYTQMSILTDMYIDCPTKDVFSQDIRTQADAALVNLYTGGPFDSTDNSDKLDHLVWATYPYAVHTINPRQGPNTSLHNLEILCDISESISFMDVITEAVAEDIYVFQVPSRIPQIAQKHFKNAITSEARRTVLSSRLSAEDTRIKCLLERTKQKITKDKKKSVSDLSDS